MYIKSILWMGTLLLATTFIFSGCQSSKVAYGNKYYFKQQPRPVQSTTVAQPSAAPEKIASLSPTDEELLASIKPELKKYRSTNKLMADAKQKLTTKLKESGQTQLANRVERISDIAASAKDQSLTREEARSKRKEIRREIRELTKEWKATSPNSENFLDDLDPYLRKAILFWGLGLILSILGVLIPFIWILASISWLVGTVFFVLWLVEELE